METSVTPSALDAGAGSPERFFGLAPTAFQPFQLPL